MNVLVMYDADPSNGTDLKIVMVARANGVTMASPVVTIKDGWSRRDANPYDVFGAAVEEFTGCYPLFTDIDVFSCASGGLERWV